MIELSKMLTEISLTRKLSVIRRIRTAFQKKYDTNDSWNQHGTAGLCEFYNNLHTCYDDDFMEEQFPELHDAIQKAYDRHGRMYGGYVNWLRPYTSRLALLNRVEKQIS